MRYTMIMINNETKTIDESTEKMVIDLAKWVATEYGVEAILELITDAGMVKYTDLYNEALYQFKAKLQNNKELMNKLSDETYKTLNA